MQQNGKNTVTSTAQWLFQGETLVQLFEFQAEQVTFSIECIFTLKEQLPDRQTPAGYSNTGKWQTFSPCKENN